jgi:hypothetical protein
MCKFFSVISNGKGDVKFFTVEEVAGLMASGNPDKLNPNSHTSVAFKNGIKGEQEDVWNKWEYCVETKIVKADNLVTFDDSADVKEKIELYLKGKNIEFMKNLYGLNSGDQNSGYRNSGDQNSGTTIGHFCSAKTYFLFNKKCTEAEAGKVYELDFSWFKLTDWICEVAMSEEEKVKYPNHKTTGGYLKVIDYKEAWKACPKEVITKIKKLKNFNKKVFKEISGLDV